MHSAIDILGPDTLGMCQGNSLVLDAGNHTGYLWDDNSTSQTRTINAAGTYDVIVYALGDNLIINGDFEQGNTGFTTDYTLGTGGTWGQLSNEGTYAINTSPSNVHNNFSNCQDHTVAPGTQMMIVNGPNTPNTEVWCQSIPVQQNTDYQFSTWVASALNNSNVAQLQFNINSTTLGAVFAPQPTGCIWSEYFQTWNSGIQTTADICIVNQKYWGCR